MIYILRNSSIIIYRLTFFFIFFINLILYNLGEHDQISNLTIILITLPPSGMAKAMLASSLILFLYKKI